MSGGDKPVEGITAEALASIDDSSYTGQLAWIRDDLKAHQGSKMRIMVMHHDPYKADGSGEMWGEASGNSIMDKLKFGMTKLLGMGDGQGRLAMIRLMQDYRVALEISGHDHSDYVATRDGAATRLGDRFVDAFTWKGGGGEVRYVNTTSTQFQTDAASDRYPGYRFIHISDGRVVSFNYKDPKWSYPWYKDTNVGGVTDLGTLTEPAISQVLPSGTDAAGEAGESEEFEFEAGNWLDTRLVGAYREVSLPYLSGGFYYTVASGSPGLIYPNRSEDPTRIFYQVRYDLEPRSTKTVALRRSDAPDTGAPNGSVTINRGAGTTGSRRVTLTFSAVDSGGAGVRDVMISNAENFEGAVWEPYSAASTWTLAEGPAGARTVYARFRDAAMPGNESPIVRAEIAYVPSN
jgi:hypothetical protein